MSVVEQADATLKNGALVVAGLIAGGLAAYFIDGLPRFALPAVGLLIIAVITYRDRRS